MNRQLSRLFQDDDIDELASLRDLEYSGSVMVEIIRVAILDDHPSIIDGYQYRLSREADIEVVAGSLYGEDLEPMLDQHPADVLLLDIQVAASRENPNPYPVLQTIPRLLQRYPGLDILVISMHTQRIMIKAAMDSGASGFVIKDDQASIQNLAEVIRTVAKGGIHFSPHAYEALMRRPTEELSGRLSARQVEAISLCVAYPDASTGELAKKMNIEGSTMRNLLSGAYLKLNVSTRAAAIAKARRMGLIPDNS